VWGVFHDEMNYQIGQDLVQSERVEGYGTNVGQNECYQLICGDLWVSV
jgi:hypothetical protein